MWKKMRIEITKITSWTDVLNCARFTQRKTLLDKEPSDEFKKQMVRAEHSPLRALMFYIDFYDIPRYVSDHLVRHIHAQPYVSTGRSDTGVPNLPREEQKMTDLYNTRLLLNAQEIINISKVRLCNKAETTTRNAWRKVIQELEKIEPILAKACVPSCFYRGFCPEIKSCGLAGTDSFYLAVNDYIKSL